MPSPGGSEPDIHNGECGLMARRELQCFFRGDSDANDRKTRIHQNLFEGYSNEIIIFDNQNCRHYSSS